MLKRLIPKIIMLLTRKMLLLNPDKATNEPGFDYDDQDVNGTLI